MGFCTTAQVCDVGRGRDVREWLAILGFSLKGLSLVRIEHLPSRTAKHLAQTLERVFRIYVAAGFGVQMAMMDMEFEKLKTLLPHVALNTTAAREHVGEIERKIRVIKERARGTFNTGMTFDYSFTKEVRNNMWDYLRNVI